MLTLHEATRRQNLTDAVRLFFTDRPNVWIPAYVLEQVGGRFAWRTRVSECRTDHRMTIENRQRMEGRTRVSEYRYVPAGQQELFR